MLECIFPSTLSGIGEKSLDNEVIGYYKFQRLQGRRTRITMFVKSNYHSQYPNYLKQVFSRFDLRYRKNVL